MIKSTSGNIFNNLWLVLLLPIFSLNLSAQISNNGNEQVFNPLTDDITERLPALSVLIDSAAFNSPDMLYEDLKADYYRYEQLSAAREWLDMLRWSVDLNFGKWDYWDWQELQISDPTNPNKFYNSQSWRGNYAVGFYIRMPLVTLIDRRNRINKQKKWIELSLTQKEINRRFLADRVINIYNDLVNFQNQIRIYNDYQGFTLAQMQMAQNEFLNGEITTAEYTRLKEIQTRGSIEFIKVIAEFQKNYYALEIITGMHFNLITIIR
jgi:outer membrane protein TolC